MEGLGFRDLYDQFQERNTEIAGVSFDDEKANTKFAKKQGFQFPLLCDTEHEMGVAYGACDAKSDAFPNRISYLIGPDGKVLQAISKVTPRTHPQEMLDLIP